MKSAITIMEFVTTVKLYHPELRVGQILSNAAHKGGWKDNDIFYCPDDTLKRGLVMMIEEALKIKK